MPSFGQVPFVRLLLPFIVGILLALSPINQFRFEFWLAFSIVSFIVYILVLLFITGWPYRWVSGVALNILIVLLGGTFTSFFPAESSINASEPVECIIRLNEPSEVRKSSVRAIAQLQQIKMGRHWGGVDEKVILYFSLSDSAAHNLEYGSVLAVKTRFNAIDKPKNPNDFDYGAYLAKRGIFRTAYVSVDSWSPIALEQNGIKSFAYKLRNSLTKFLYQSGVRDQNLAIASALVMGYKSLLDEETQQAFSASGAMHILAVSGLHVGILFVILASALFFFDRIKHGRYVKAIFLIFALWAFALFTGLSPSVMRASLMFSLVVLGKALSRSTNVYNTLCASAFILLVSNPMLISDLGFLLSYSAVIAIIFFYPHIYSWLYVRNRFLDKVWALIAVSLAAQLGTFPLGLFFFNQFPNYFLLTNLFAIPLATVILYLILLIIVCSPITFLSVWVGWLLSKSISLLIFLVNLVEQLPASTLNGVVISPLQVLLLYGSIIVFGLFLIYRKTIFTLAVLSCILVFVALSSMSKVQSFSRNEVILFNMKGNTAIGFMNSGRFVLVSDNNSKALKAIKGYLIENRVSNKVECFDLNSLEILSKNRMSIKNNPMGKLILFDEKIAIIPKGKKNFLPPSEPIAVDYLIITAGNNYTVETLLNFVLPKKIIIDGSLSFWQTDYLKRKIIARGIPLHSTMDNGAYFMQVP